MFCQEGISDKAAVVTGPGQQPPSGDGRRLCPRWQRAVALAAAPTIFDNSASCEKWHRSKEMRGRSLSAQAGGIGNASPRLLDYTGATAAIPASGKPARRKGRCGVGRQKFSRAESDQRWTAISLRRAQVCREDLLRRRQSSQTTVSLGAVLWKTASVREG